MKSKATVRRVLVIDLRQLVLPRVSQVGGLQAISKGTMNGTFKILRGTDECGIEDEVFGVHFSHA